MSYECLSKVNTFRYFHEKCGRAIDGRGLTQLYWYSSRWYDHSLGRFAQADSIVPVDTQGVQAFDRYAYANNNPVLWVDPSGHGVDCGIGEPSCRADFGEVPTQSSPIRHKHSDPILLDGGIGTASYGTAAGDSYTGFGSSGESQNSRTSGYIGASGLVNDFLVWLRDNTPLREWLGNRPNVYGTVYYQKTNDGIIINGASISNYSFERLEIASVYLSVNDKYDQNIVYSGALLYPYNYPSIQALDYGEAAPNTVSDIVRLQSDVISYQQNADISIRVFSQSGRFGALKVSLFETP